MIFLHGGVTTEFIYLILGASILILALTIWPIILIIKKYKRVKFQDVERGKKKIQKIGYIVATFILTFISLFFLFILIICIESLI